jgi:hypothetical protein
LVIVAGFLYLRSQAARPNEQNQTTALAQPQLAAGAPPTTTQSAAQPQTAPMAQTREAPPSPTVASAQPGSAPSSILQAPTAQAPTTEPKAQALPLPAAEQGPLPDAGPPPEAAPTERPVADDGLSRNLTDYLHHHRLPYVDATVYAKAGAPSSIALSGEVRSEMGKEDAETKSRDFLGNARLKVRNHVRINPELASRSQPASSAGVGAPIAGGAPAAEANPCTDLCQRDEGSCEVHCQNQSLGSATGVGGGFGDLLRQIGQAGGEARDCIENCHQTLNHCAADCSAGGPSQQSNEPAGGAGHGEGPDQPPG